MKILSSLSSPHQMKSSGENKSPKSNSEYPVNYSNANSHRQTRESQLQKLIQNSVKSPKQNQKNSDLILKHPNDPNFSGEI